MTVTTTAGRAIPPGHYRLVHVMRSEWIKLRSTRSIRWLLVATVAGTLALGVTDCLVEAAQWGHMAAASRGHAGGRRLAAGPARCLRTISA